MPFDSIDDILNKPIGQAPAPPSLDSFFKPISAPQAATQAATKPPQSIDSIFDPISPPQPAAKPTNAGEGLDYTTIAAHSFGKGVMEESKNIGQGVRAAAGTPAPTLAAEPEGEKDELDKLLEIPPERGWYNSKWIVAQAFKYTGASIPSAGLALVADRDRPRLHHRDNHLGVRRRR